MIEGENDELKTIIRELQNQIIDQKAKLETSTIFKKD